MPSGNKELLVLIRKKRFNGYSHGLGEVAEQVHGIAILYKSFACPPFKVSSECHPRNPLLSPPSLSVTVALPLPQTSSTLYSPFAYNYPLSYQVVYSPQPQAQGLTQSRCSVHVR